jgi:hypothetical protein
MQRPEGNIHRIRRDPLRFELLRLFEAHLDPQSGSLQDPKAPSDFTANLGKPLTKALADPGLLRGLRTEALFEALIVSLGSVELIKQEDVGEAWTTRTGLKIPDYRIILPDANQFLVEVKHFHQSGTPTTPYRISANYFRGLETYENLVGSSVKLAVYWSAWNLWTLVPLSAWTKSGRPSLSLEKALQLNEMGMLGDLQVATEYPLRFRLVADQRAESTIDASGQAQFTIGDVEMYCRDRLLTKRHEQTIAMWLMLYGSWVEEATAEVRNHQPVAVDYVFAPQKPGQEEFSLVGALSSLFSRRYLSSTSDGDAVRRIGLSVSGGSLGAMIPDDYDSETLPLWRFRQATN